MARFGSLLLGSFRNGPLLSAVIYERVGVEEVVAVVFDGVDLQAQGGSVWCQSLGSVRVRGLLLWFVMFSVWSAVFGSFSNA